MNEKAKKLMKEQRMGIKKGLEDHFKLLVVEDELAEDEEEQLQETGYNCFTIEYGEFQPSSNERTISQNIYVSYLSENQDDLDEQTIDIISLVSKVKKLSFVTSKNDRLQMKDTDRYIDRVFFTFRRMIPIECIST
ncbi:hypothetical protein bcere0016_5000 [Bacillus cereus 95/8201]|uniref:hypothetical protein n=1 Tax=Bacillus cereus group TaxID=86661 RepID=UPI0001A09617|nr:hypothetical protein [Bacillus cereus]AJH61646.1 hypothetical protein BG11_3142 [Bacillus cereus]AJK35597.1 hypothetical protein BF33_3729 [Bacillus cereus]EEL18814.1 hypothetical protein bcere0016_5000 [Bacillus cereus 95/8201]MDQ4440175.1 hypothetical protein [Bacillus cereus]BCC54914.1 hypothetical protein BCJMU07_4264 [Bacillus cereus]